MWDRKVLKARGKRAFKANYWKCVLVALILTLVAGAGTGTSGVSTTQSINDNRDQVEQQDDFDFNDDLDNDADDIIDDYDFDDSELDDINNPPIDLDDPGNGTDDGFMAAVIGIVLFVILIAVLIGLIIAALLLNPLQVGCRRFFVNNSESKDAADIGDVGFAFSKNYKNVVKTMFFRDIWIFLWALLLIVPGIIKSLEYRMVPYLLAENPDMDRKEAFKKSSEMMYGNKWDAFVLDLSFFGWVVLATCTFGILAVFYVNPYIAATDAELYKVISGRRSGFADEADVAADAALAADTASSANVAVGETADGPKSPEEDVIVTFNESDGENYIDDIYD